jgi:Conserved membrane protein YqhR
MPGKSRAIAIVLGGLVAGTVDIGAASLINMVNPVLILHFIASGLIGRAAFTGGWETAAAGLLLQWLMSLIIAALFVSAAEWIALLRRRWVVSGVAYGVVIFAVMNFVIVPLSAAPKPHRAMQPDKIVENLLAMLLFGLIVSYFARRLPARA